MAALRKNPRLKAAPPPRIQPGKARIGAAASTAMAASDAIATAIAGASRHRAHPASRSGSTTVGRRPQTRPRLMAIWVGGADASVLTEEGNQSKLLIAQSGV